ncbi:unnamed protein product [Ectocarpus sp. 6 AP-2014]
MMPLMASIPCWVLRLLAVTAVVCTIALGEVHNLGDNDFDDFVADLPEQALLLVDFYKPGCRHCQRLSPVLDYLEAEWEKEEPDDSKRWFKLAKVDIEKNPRLKTVFGIAKLPDLRFVRAGRWGTYQGGRLIEASNTTDIKEFKERMALVPLRFVDADALTGLTRSSEAVFVLSANEDADPSTVAPGVLLAATLSQHEATFCTTSPEVLASLGLGVSGVSPALVKVVAGQGGRLLQPAAYKTERGTQGVNDDIATVSVAAVSSWSVLSWVERERFGLVSDLSPDNFMRLGSLGRLMVLGVFDPKHEATRSFHKVFGDVASDMGVRHSERLMFGTVNRVTMPGFMETFNVYEGHPQVIVMDIASDEFYTLENMRMEVGEMKAFLIDVLAGFIPARVPSTNSARYAMKIWWLVQKGGAWSFLLLIPVVALVWVFCDTPQREEARAALREVRKTERDEALRRKNQ